MPPVDLATTDIERHARRASERAVREASPWIEALGRFGHAAIGLVYATIGALAAQAAELENVRTRLAEATGGRVDVDAEA